MSSSFGMFNIELTLLAGQQIKIKLTGQLRENNLPHRPFYTTAISSEISGRLCLFARAVRGRTFKTSTVNSIDDHKMKFPFRFFLK